MKVIVLSYDFKPNWGGVATVAHEVASSLAKDFQYEVTVLAPKLNSHKIFDQKQAYQIERYGTPKISLLSTLFTLYKLYRLNKKNKFDIAFALLWIPDGICLYFINLIISKKLPYLVYVHGVEILETDSTLMKRIRALLNPLKTKVLEKAIKVICVSSFTESQVKKYTSVTNSLVLNNGVNNETFKNLNSSPPAVFTFITVARLEDYKGVDICLEAFALLKNAGIDFRYKVVGTGDDQNRLHQIVKTLKLEKQVQFLGSLETEQVVKEYSSASCFILLSRADFKTPNVEGLGLVFLEAAACGLPSIAGNSGGVSDAVLDQKTGLLVNPIDPTQVFIAMKRMMTDRLFYQSVKSKALERAVMELNWKRQVNVIDEIIKEYVRN